jgi:hypothetical protein
MKLFICTLLPFEPSRFAGGYQAMYSLISQLDLKEVTSLYHWGEPEHETSVNIYYRRVSRLNGYAGWAHAQLCLWRLLKRERPDLIVCSPDRARVSVVLILAWLLKIKTCIWQMDDIVAVPDSKGAKLILNKIFRYIFMGLAYRSSSYRIAASKPLAQLLERRYGKRVDRIVAKPLDRTYSCEYKILKGKPINFVYAGSASVEFYLEPVIKIAHFLERNFKDQFFIYLYGPNEFPKELLSYSCIKSLGSLAEDNTVEPLLKFDYALLTYSDSLQVKKFFASSFPSKLIGYLGAGLPVISILSEEIYVYSELKKWDVGPVAQSASEEQLRSLIHSVSNATEERWRQWSFNSTKWAKSEFLVNLNEIIEEMNRD